MAQINFKPVCSNCGKVLNDTIDFDGDKVIPEFCSHCGSWFDLITLPTDLPYKHQEKEISFCEYEQ